MPVSGFRGGEEDSLLKDQSGMWKAAQMERRRSAAHGVWDGKMQGRLHVRFH